ncbi:dynamin-like protein ARC5 [Pistacia vera]|uniref:dynamin-like protein ARC5 n=1 Tax=Pistacia vera TaxID=55513 RepID=UPI0012634BB5|nr:dynamin-like protein ARC5 [Pistacia vera]
MEPREEDTIANNYNLYEAYNELHGLAQELETPFDAPAVLVVGHQTDGKSSLVEALMGFQFNHVGGGTKTRRPITLHMKYDPLCEVPLCHLVCDHDPSLAHEKSLQEIQVLFTQFSYITIVKIIIPLYSKTWFVFLIAVKQRGYLD